MKKLTYSQMIKEINKHNEENHIERQYGDENPLICVVVFKANNWKDTYSEISRAYEFRSDNKYFLPKMLGNSWYADCLDGSDQGVRLDWYDWEIEYCFIKPKNLY